MPAPPDNSTPSTRARSADSNKLDTKLIVLAVGLILGVTLVAFEVTAIVTALPTLTDELGGDSLYGVALAIYTLANMVSLIIAGRLADRRGPTGVYLLSVAVFVVGLLVAGAAPNMWVFVLGRLLQGLGSGGFSPVAFILVKRAFPEARQPMMYAWLSAGWVLPSLVGPLFGGLITDAFGWRWVFYGIVPVALLVGLLGAIPMRAYGPSPHAGDGEDRRMAVLAVLAAAGIGALVLALPASNIVVVVLGSLIGLAVAAPALRRLLPPGSFVARPGFPAVLTVRLLAAATFIGVDSIAPLAADRIHGASPIVQGFVIVGASIAWPGGQMLSTRWAGLTASRASRVGFAIMGLATLAVVPILWAGWPLWAVFVAWTVGGIGMGVLYNPTTVASMTYAEPGREGAVSGQVRLIDSLGFSLGYGIGGAFIAAADRGQIELVTALALGFAAALVAAGLGLAASRGVRAAN
jgi:MFS family permease